MLITDPYKAQQEQLHESHEGYGVRSVQYANLISSICNNLGILHLLDYGCGKGRLFEALTVKHKMKLQAYDPAVPRFSTPPVPAEMVCCIDVLEHIELECLDEVLDDLERLTENVIFLSITCAPARKTLPDGRNAHLIVQPIEWWLPKIWERFELHTVQFSSADDTPMYFVIAYSRKGPIEGTNGEKLEYCQL